jgi:hypothetical protein
MTQDLSFDKVLELLAMEESSPDYDVLEKWQALYPRYKKELAQYFATWAIQKDQTAPSVLDKERLAAEGKKRVMEMLRRQGRIVPADKIEPLSQFDQLVLTAVYLLHGDGDTASITEKISEMTGQEVYQEATSLALRGLKQRLLVDSWVPDTEIEPDVESTHYYTVTMTGERALAHAKATSKVVADFLGDFA